MQALHQVKQQANETIDSFFMRVKEKINDINMSELDKNGIIELVTLAQMVSNCHSTGVRQKALKDGLNLKIF